jgi:amidase
LTGIHPYPDDGAKEAHTLEPRRLIAIIVLLLTQTIQVKAQTLIPSGARDPWDIEAGILGSDDTGAIVTGGESRPLSGFGYLFVETLAENSTLSNYVTDTGLLPLRGFQFSRQGASSLNSARPVIINGISVRRRIDVNQDGNVLRYYDKFANFTGRRLKVRAAIGGGMAWRGNMRDPQPALFLTSTGDQYLDHDDLFLVVTTPPAQQAASEAGVSLYGPAAFIFGHGADGFGDSSLHPLKDKYPGSDPSAVAAQFTMILEPGQSRALVTFVVRGSAASVSTKRPSKNQITPVIDHASALVRQPWLNDLAPRELDRILNWQKSPRTIPRGGIEGFSVVEATIRATQDALAARRTTVAELLEQYSDRIQAYDRNGAHFNAFLSLSPTTDPSITMASTQSTKLQPLRGITVAVKDNIDVAGLPSTSGSIAFKNRLPLTSADAVVKLQRAGAFVIGKTNMDELGTGAFGYSSLGGQTRNAYFLERHPGGSSSGSAVAVATSMAAVALGTDTCDSLTTPAAFAELVSLRPTHGEISTDGVMPHSPALDVLGPMARSVEDAARIMDVLVDSDMTDVASGRYFGALHRDSLRGVRLGVLQNNVKTWPDNVPISEALLRAFEALREQGAIVVDIEAADLADKTRAVVNAYPPNDYLRELPSYLARAPEAEIKSFDDMLTRMDRGLFGARAERFLVQRAAQRSDQGRSTEAFTAARAELRNRIGDILRSHQVDALIYVANLVRPPRIGDPRYPFGNCRESSASGYPHVVVPAGTFGVEHFPFGLIFLGLPNTDERLLAYAYAFEQATRHRHPSPLAP